MPIPDFVDGYHLPRGIHEATLKEVEDRFGNSTNTRIRVWKCFLALMDRLNQLGLTPDEIYIDGSFVTGRNEPGDVDFAVLIRPGKTKRALKTASDHDKRAIQLFSNPAAQDDIRDLFGAHFLIADVPMALDKYTSLFRVGLPGVGLRDPEPNKDPSWVKKPKEKGIIRLVEETN